MSTALPSRVDVSPNVMFQDLGDESVLLNLDNDRYYGLDDVGTKMWQMMAEHGDIDTVVDRLLTEYAGQTDAPTVRRDLGTLINKLTEAGMLTVTPGSE
jgi:hypothetical protein